MFLWSFLKIASKTLLFHKPKQVGALSQELLCVDWTYVVRKHVKKRQLGNYQIAAFVLLKKTSGFQRNKRKT